MYENNGLEEEEIRTSKAQYLSYEASSPSTFVLISTVPLPTWCGVGAGPEDRIGLAKNSSLHRAIMHVAKNCFLHHESLRGHLELRR